jgi:hypothetical protein
MKQLALIARLLLLISTLACGAQAATSPVNLAIVGLTHDHAMGFLPLLQDQRDVRLVGIVETNSALIERYARRFKLAPGLFFPSLEMLLKQTPAQTVATFTSTYDHLQVVESCATHGIDVMMEKPLAVNMIHARRMADAARRGHIQVIVNYETTWYPGNQAAYAIALDQHAIGDIRKIVVHDGHCGPKEIGCSSFFLSWLTDPLLNGGGALNDFGCYGADLSTWLMRGQRPTSVFAVTQQLKPALYPKVEDEATLILTYPGAQTIIQASWNWPFDRKDLEIYGQTGSICVPKPGVLRLRTGKTQPEIEQTPSSPAAPWSDPLSYLAAVVRRQIQPAGLSSLAVNLIVTEILDAAHESARQGRRIDLDPLPK